jgi:hypothetical protein
MNLFIFKNISSTFSPFYKIIHFAQIEIFFTTLFNFNFNMGVFNILNIKRKIIIMLIIVPKKNILSIH